MAGKTLAEQTQQPGESSSVLSAPWPYALAGIIILAAATYLQVGGSAEVQQADNSRQQAQSTVRAVTQPVQQFYDLSRDESLQQLAEEVIEGTAEETQLRSAAQALLPTVVDVNVIAADVFLQAPELLGDDGFILLDMFATVLDREQAPVQMIRRGNEQLMVTATAVGRAAQEKGFLVLYARATEMLEAFRGAGAGARYLALEMQAGGNAPPRLGELGDGVPAGYGVQRLVVPNSLFRVAFAQNNQPAPIGVGERWTLFALGGLLLLFGAVRYYQGRDTSTPLAALPDNFATIVEDEAPEPAPQRPAAPKPDQPPRAFAPAPKTPKQASDDATFPQFPERTTISDDNEVLAGLQESITVVEDDEPVVDVHLSDLPQELQDRHDKDDQDMSDSKPVELTSGIFRAYDIRGIVGETLDAQVAYQIGQAVGSLALDSMAGPLVVGRDGRHSGPGLVQGLLKGISSTGCDVIDVGAVPTGALYFAAYELGDGSGVMVTGSHNPPNYNGFKIMIAGKTLSGDSIFGLYGRLLAENLRKGTGEIDHKEVLDAYRERITSDIQLKRPLKVVADCGNGIGGSCAADILRGIGAEVIPLFDEVDGDFPNHHPDPSEPENLRDLIESVRLMDADIGVAFDGDADRLGVVTPAGEIVFSDRVMMLFAREVLSRNPGSPIIYDVKCTGHLDHIIRDAGGEPEMYKTGHSLIKNRMKEVNAPFAGEMSGHFFFKDRWYGFDCGIYSAARLLEILAMSPDSPTEVLQALPNSFSTPELKVQLKEGENHDFIDAFQEKADFPEARVTTIDGVRADFEDGWGLVRASNTTPILVLRFDGDTPEALTRISEAFREQLLALKPDMKLPF